jgi:hypothetical protein
MNRHIAIHRLLAVLMIAGLVLAPVSRPVMAALAPEVSMEAMADEMSPSAMTGEMASDMPCCPSEAPVDCSKCVLMATCMTKCFTGMTATFVHPFLVVSASMALQRNDFRPDDLGHPPPEHPPRILV